MCVVDILWGYKCLSLKKKSLKISTFFRQIQTVKILPLEMFFCRHGDSNLSAKRYPSREQTFITSLGVFLKPNFTVIPGLS